MKNICLLCGSPNPTGNTNQLARIFTETVQTAGCVVRQFQLYDLDLRPCTACRCCQKDHTIFGCPQPDDMQAVFDAILWCDLVVLASPIYSWYCTPPMKAVLDRMVYGMNKYYGQVRGPALWEGKEVAILATCGYRPEQGADLFQGGVRRYCKHSKLRYLGMLAERHLGYGTTFMDEAKRQDTIAFAKRIIL